VCENYRENVELAGVRATEQFQVRAEPATKTRQTTYTRLYQQLSISETQCVKISLRREAQHGDMRRCQGRPTDIGNCIYNYIQRSDVRPVMF
jgi:hypothetical protein